MHAAVSFEIDGDFESDVGESGPIEFHGGSMVCEIGYPARECTDSSFECSALDTIVFFLNESGHHASFKCAAEKTGSSWNMDGVLQILANSGGTSEGFLPLGPVMSELKRSSTNGRSVEYLAQRMRSIRRGVG